MQAESASGLDWRDAAAYAPLIDADRSLFAWEWLRRDPRYREAAGPGARCGDADCNPTTFGLVAFEPPRLAVPDARPLWSAQACPSVLRVEPGRCAGAGDTFDRDRLAAVATLVRSHAGEHLLLSDGLRTIRLDGPAGMFSGGATCLRYRMEGMVTAEAQLRSLRRFLSLFRTGRFSRELHHREPRAGRWILTLRTWDALIAGAGQREIAHLLLSNSIGDPGWRVREPSVRSQAQRLVRSARAFAAGGYRALLIGRAALQATSMSRA